MNNRRINKQVRKYTGLQSRRNSGGFTIIELIIATAIFSVILLVALTAFIQISRLFYKGISVTQTQQTATDILNDISENLQAGRNVSVPAPVPHIPGHFYFCVGNVRYTYRLNNKVDYSTPNPFGSGAATALVRDVLPGGSSCALPCALGGHAVLCPAPEGGVKWKNPSEMLGNRMRLEVFEVTQVSAISPDYYNVKVVVFYGEDADKLGSGYEVNCQGAARTKQFCAVAKYNTGLYRGKNI